MLAPRISKEEMTTINHNVKPDVKQEVRRIREAAKKVASSKESAVHFLQETGMHTARGGLKPQFR
jgi:hypothetical protein